MTRLTERQLHFFDTFGYIALPGLMTDKIAEITEAFEQIWTDHGGGHNGKPHDGVNRSCIVPFLDHASIEVRWVLLMRWFRAVDLWRDYRVGDVSVIVAQELINFNRVLGKAFVFSHVLVLRLVVLLPPAFRPPLFFAAEGKKGQKRRGKPTF